MAASQTLDDSAFKFFALVLLGLYLCGAIAYTLRRVRAVREERRTALQLARTRAERSSNARRLATTKKTVLLSRGFIVHLVILSVALIAFAALLRDVASGSTVKSYDPYDILGVSHDADERKIKSAYRRLSLQYHPDKEGGNEDKFVAISKAYAALTDETARENFRKYGNPDGPAPLVFGLGLPSFLADSKLRNHLTLLYVSLLAIAVPLLMSWWSKQQTDPEDTVTPSDRTLYWSSRRVGENTLLRHLPGIYAGAHELSVMPCKETDMQWLKKLQKRLPDLAINSEKHLTPEFSNILGITLEDYKVNHAALLAWLSNVDTSELEPAEMDALAQRQDLVLRQAPKLVTALSRACFGPPKPHLSVEEAGETTNKASKGGRKKKGKDKKKDKESADQQGNQVHGKPMTFLRVVEFSQVLCQGIWPDSHEPAVNQLDSLRQLPGFTSSVCRAVAARGKVRNLLDFIRLPAALRPGLDLLASQDRDDCLRLLATLPNLKIQATMSPSVADETEVGPGDIVMLRVKLEHLNDVALEEAVAAPDNLLVVASGGGATGSDASASTEAIQSFHSGASLVDPTDKDVDDGRLCWPVNNTMRPSAEDQAPVPPAHTPRFPLPVSEKWFLLLTDEAGGGFRALDRVNESKRVMRCNVPFQAPMTKGTYKYVLHAKSNCYLGLDQSIPLTLCVTKDPVVEEEEETASQASDEPTDEATLEEWLGANLDKELEDDSDVEEEEEEDEGDEEREAGEDGQGSDEEDDDKEQAAPSDAAMTSPETTGLTAAQLRKRQKRLRKKAQ